jgi:hypothetical protein
MANNLILLELEDHPSGLSGQELAARTRKSYTEVCVELIGMAESDPPLVLLRGGSGKWIIASAGRRRTGSLRRNWEHGRAATDANSS